MIMLSNQEVATIVNTLKNMDVRGYDSMDRLVGLVLYFERKASQAMPEAVRIEAGGGETEKKDSEGVK